MRYLFRSTLLSGPTTLVLLIVFFGSAASGQEVRDTAVTVPGRLVIESGAVYTNNDDGGTDLDTFSVPATVFRTGLRDETELQVEWSGYQWEQVNDRRTEHGAGDAAISVKQILYRESIQFPRTAVLIGTSVPVGSDAFSSNRFDPAALGIFEYSFGASVTAQAHTGVQWTTETGDGGDRHTNAAGVYALALFYNVSPSTQGFVEGYGQVPIDDGTPAHTLDVGIWQDLGRNYEVSAWYGRGLSDAAEDHLLATELVVSF